MLLNYLMIKNQIYQKKKEELYKMVEEYRHILMKKEIQLVQLEYGYWMKIFQD